MKILSHRGYWRESQEKNSMRAFSRSFELGFGTETDIRDNAGELVISHDIPCGGEIPFQNLLDLMAASREAQHLTLALNVKADGLAGILRNKLSSFRNLDAFVFDMSVPDTRTYHEAGIPVFARMSEVEQDPVWLKCATGIWLDAFEYEWYDIGLIQNLLDSDKRVCLVSPELHGRPHMPLWRIVIELQERPNLMICTDYPEDARSFFQGV